MAAELHITPSRATNSNGLNIDGAKWFFYLTGTTTKTDVFTTSALSVAHTNPVVADAAGKFPNIYMDTSKTYRAVLKSADEATTIYDIDPVNDSVLSALAASSGSSLLGFIQAGTGAVATTAQVEMRKTFRVSQFGAVGGGADQRANIQNCLNAAGVNANIHFEPGVNYSISPIGNPSGTGTEATFGGLRPLAGQTLFLNGCTLTALTPGLNNASCVINVYGVNDVTVQGPGNIIGDRNIGTGGRTGEFGHCVSLRGGNNLSVRDCNIESAWGDGVYVGPTQGGTDYPVGVLIDNNEFDDISRNAISVVTARNVAITNNRCRRVNRTAPKAFIDLEPDNPFPPNRDCIIHGNTCIPDASDVAQVDFGLYLVGANTRILVSDNSFYGLFGSVGIGNSTINCRVAGNILRAGTSGSAGNIWMTATTPSTIDGVSICDNDIIGGLTHAIHFNTTGYFKLNISGNRIFVNQSGARLAALAGGSQTIFQNNEVFFTGDALDGQAFIGDFSGVVMGGNRFSNTTGNTAQSFLTTAIEVTPDFYGTGLTRDNAGALGGYGAQVGFQTGVGGTVTQATSKSTGVTLNKPCGTITMHNAALAATTSVGFTVTNSTIAATDVIMVSIKSGATADSYVATVDAVAAGSFRISLRNITAGSLGEAVVISFAKINAVAA